MTEVQDKELNLLSDIYAELRNDAKEITKLLVKGVEFYRVSGIFSIIFAAMIAYILLMAFLFQPLTIIHWILIGLGTVTVALYLFIAFRYLHRYSDLKTKYKKLIEIEELLGE